MFCRYAFVRQGRIESSADPDKVLMFFMLVSVNHLNAIRVNRVKKVSLIIC